MRFTVAAMACFLAACAPQIVYKPVPVNVPVEVRCKAPLVPAPVLAIKTVSSADTMFNQAKALAVTNEQRNAYEAQLVASIKSCQ